MHVRVSFWRVVPFVRWLLTNEQCLVFRGEVEGTWGFLIFCIFPSVLFLPKRRGGRLDGFALLINRSNAIANVGLDRIGKVRRASRRSPIFILHPPSPGAPSILCPRPAATAVGSKSVSSRLVTREPSSKPPTPTPHPHSTKPANASPSAGSAHATSSTPTVPSPARYLPPLPACLRARSHHFHQSHHKPPRTQVVHIHIHITPPRAPFEACQSPVAKPCRLGHGGARVRPASRVSHARCA